MIIQITYDGHGYQCDLSKPLDISVPAGQVRCFYATEFAAYPYVSGSFTGSVKAGAPVNFFEVRINPHGNGTHTECFGHITEEQEVLDDHMQKYHFVARLVSVSWEGGENGDRVVTAQNLRAVCPGFLPEAVIIRTLPNAKDKLTADYSGTNPPYLERAAIEFLVQAGVRHLLLDLPSVDREEDGGRLLAHRAFWKVESTVAQQETRRDCTITELVYVPDRIADGLYLLNIQIPTIRLDVAPSKPVLYELT